MAIKLIFWDRDGVINIGRPPVADDATAEEKKKMYVLSKDEFELVPGIKETLKQLKEANPHLYNVLITKQRCVERGLITVEELEEIHQQMQELLEFKFNDIEVQTHKIEGQSKDALMIAAMQKFDLNPEDCAMIGDRASDMELGLAAKIPIRILVTWQSERDGLTEDLEKARELATHVFSTPDEAIKELNLSNEDFEHRLETELS